MDSFLHRCVFCSNHTLISRIILVREHGSFPVLRCTRPECFNGYDQIHCRSCKTTVPFRKTDVCNQCLRFNHGCQDLSRFPITTCVLCKHETCYDRCSTDAKFIGHPGGRVCMFCLQIARIEKPHCRALTQMMEPCKRNVKGTNVFCSLHKGYKGMRTTDLGINVHYV